MLTTIASILINSASKIALNQPRTMTQEEFFNIPNLPNEHKLTSLATSLLNQTIDQFNRKFKTKISKNYSVQSYHSPIAQQYAQQHQNIPKDAFIIGNTILINLNELGENLNTSLIYDLSSKTIHEVAHLFYNSIKERLSKETVEQINKQASSQGYKPEEYVAEIIRYSFDKKEPFNPSTAPKDYPVYAMICHDLNVSP